MEIYSAKKPASTPGLFCVTNLKPSLHDENRVNVFLNEKFEFSLDISQVIDFGVKVGKNFSKEEVENLRKASEFGKLYQRTLEWVLTRPRSIKETADHLKRKKLNRTLDNKRRLNAKRYKEEHKDENPYRNPDNLDENGHLKFRNSPWAIRTEFAPEISDENIAAVMARLIEKGYLDDLKFAKFYVENRFVKKGISTKRLKMELSKKGIAKDIIDEVFSQSSRSEEAEIKKIIMRKRAQYDDEKLIQYLCHQGFDYSTSRELAAQSSETDSQNLE